MKTVGIIGGIGPESTIEYYRLIISAFLEQEKSGSYPQIIINSINLKKMIDFMVANELNELTDYLLAEIDKIALAGADFGVLAANTPHIVYNRIKQSSPVPLISIVEATCKKAVSEGIQRIGLFGTKFTMQGGFYDQVFSDYGIEVISPEIKDQEYIHDKYMNELLKGIIRDNTKNNLLDIIKNLHKSKNIQGLILGGTELSLILKNTDKSVVPLFDTTRIHVESIVNGLL